MSGRKKKSNELEKNVPDEVVSVLSKHDDLPHIKELLKEKPHLSLIKHVEIDSALRESNTYVLSLVERLLMSGREEDDQKKDEETTIALAALVLSILDYSKYSESVFILKILSKLSNLTICDNISTQVKTGIAELCERFMELSQDHCTASIKIGMFTLHYLLDLTLLVKDDKALKKNIKRVWSMRKFLDLLDLCSPSCSVLLSKLMSTVTNSSYLKCKEGEHVIGHFMSRDVSIVKEIHKIVITEIPKMTKHLASSYGSIYFVAWNTAKEEVQKEIEECIQDIMVKVLNIPRAGYEMPKAGNNAFGILHKLHQARNRKSFSHVLNHLYSAVLWLNLGSDDAWKRCNAAQVFLDVFPLEKPYSTAPENDQYMERQIKTMKDLLLDDSHFVRVISVKGVCASLATSIELFSVGQLRDICNILFDNLPFDSSSYMVRKSIFEGLEMMLGLPPPSDEQPKNPCQTVIEPILHCLHHSFYDENEKVRKAFAKMLVKIKEQDSILDVRYWHVIPLQDLLNQLAIEKCQIGEILARVIKDDVYPKKRDINKTISRLCKMLDWSTEGIKNFFRFSHKVLTVEEAYSLIVTIIGVIRKNLKDYLNCVENENNAAQGRKSMLGKSKSRGKGTLEDISNKNLEKEKDSDCETSVSSTSGSPPPVEKQLYEFLGAHKYISGLIQMATVTWVIHRKELSAKEEYLTNLYALATNSIPMLLKHYKDTPVYYSTVSFASLIPLGKLRPYSTISSACISELKKANNSTESSKLECLIYSLCCWNLGIDVLDLAAEWLNFAFREQDLNTTAVVVKAGQKKVKVRFQQKDGKPLMALKILDILFSDVLNETRILQKNYEHLNDFYTCLERINIILERRMADPQSFNKADSSLTDEFIYRVYCRYLRLMHSLHRPDTQNAPDSLPPFDASLAFTNAINFASNVLCPHIPEDENAEADNLAVKCCIAVMKEATISIQLGVTSQLHSHALCVFANDLISHSKRIWFLEDTVLTVQAMAEHVQYFMPTDEWHLLSRILPSLMEKALDISIDLDNSETPYKSIFKDVSKYTRAFFGFLKAVYRHSGGKSELFLNSLRKFINACILTVEKKIYEEEEVLFYSKLDDHPFLVSFILKNLLIEPILNMHIVPALTYHINKFNKEEVKILSCISILYTLTYCARQRIKIDAALEDAVQTSCQVVLDYKPIEKSKNSDDFSSSSVNFDVKTIAEPVLLELSKLLNCSLVRPEKRFI